MIHGQYYTLSARKGKVEFYHSKAHLHLHDICVCFLEVSLVFHVGSDSIAAQNAERICIVDLHSHTTILYLQYIMAAAYLAVGTVSFSSEVTPPVWLLIDHHLIQKHPTPGLHPPVPGKFWNTHSCFPSWSTFIESFLCRQGIESTPWAWVHNPYPLS